VNQDGSLRWRLRTGGITQSSPVIAPNGVIFVAVNATLWAITPDGKKKWERLLDTSVDSSPLVLADGTVCIPSPWTLIATDPEDLTVKWTFHCPPQGQGSPTVGSSGVLYSTGDPSGAVLSAVRVGQPLATSGWPKFRGNLRNTGNLEQ
jgi:hypothetical protein